MLASPEQPRTRGGAVSQLLTHFAGIQDTSRRESTSTAVTESGRG